jgi:hypothetical protein
MREAADAGMQLAIRDPRQLLPLVAAAGQKE